jgi:MFS family permease
VGRRQLSYLLKSYLMAMPPPFWRRLLVDIAPLRESPAYRRAWTGQLVSFVGTQMTMVALPVQVYQLTDSAFAVGLLGAVELLPVLALGLLGGAIVDAADLRRVLLTTSSLLALGSGVLAAQALFGLQEVWLLYLAAAFLAAVSAVDGPARSLLAPRLLPPGRIPAASALTHLSLNIGLTGGPLIAGVLIAAFGAGAAYSFDVLSFGYALYAVARLGPMRPEGGGTPPSMRSIVEGLNWVRRQPVILMAFLLDFDAMIFGMPRALFPALAETHFNGDASTAGLLYASPAIGALLGGALSGPLGRIRQQGLAVILSVAIWGLAITGFGLSPYLWLAVLLLGVAGAADLASAVMRRTIVQLATPDAMRGRVSGLYIINVTGGPRLGDLEAGTVAALAGPTVSAWSGGVLCLLVLSALVAVYPGFARYSASPSTTLQAEAVATNNRTKDR